MRTDAKGAGVSGDRPPTIYDVAAAAGVSHQTVARMLRGYTGFRAETRAKVFEAIDLLGYRANASARSLRTGSTQVIALAVPGLRQPYFAELAELVVVEARAVGLTVFVEVTGGDADGEYAVFDRMRTQAVDGVLFAPKRIAAEQLAELRLAIPMVILGDHVLDQAFDHVTLPNRAGAVAAVRHLIESGRRRIAFFGHEPPETGGAAALRLEGYHHALASAGLYPDPRLLVSTGEWERTAGAEAMTRFLERDVSFDAVFCANDALAVGALRVLLERGLRVPADVAIVGFDDTEDARFTQPALTSVAPDYSEFVRAAIQLLRARMGRSGGPAEPADVVPGFQLRVRGSSRMGQSSSIIR